MEGRTLDQEDEERKTSWLGPVHPWHNGLRLVSWLPGGWHADLCAHSCLAQLSVAFLVWVRIWPAACSWVPLWRSGTRGSLENVGLCQASATAGPGSLGMMTREQLPAQLTGALPPRAQGESAKDHSTFLSPPLHLRGVPSGPLGHRKGLCGAITPPAGGRVHSDGAEAEEQRHPSRVGGLGAGTVRVWDHLGPAGQREEAGLTGKLLVKCISSKYG